MGQSKSREELIIDKQIFKPIAINTHRELLKNDKPDIKSIEEKYAKFQRANVHGKDPMGFVKPEQCHMMPYSAIFRLDLMFKHLYRGTAALIGPKHALTVLHNVYDEKAEVKWVSSVRAVSPNTTEDTIIDAYAHHVYKFDDCDLALLVFNEELGTEFFTLDVAREVLARPQTKRLTVTGYPGETTNKSMRTHEGNFIDFDKSGALLYNVETLKGQSGSPVWVKKENAHVLIGIHNGANEFNQGVPLDKEHIRQIDEWVQKDSPNRTNSYHKLQGRARAERILAENGLIKEHKKNFKINYDYNLKKLTIIKANNDVPDSELSKLAEHLQGWLDHPYVQCKTLVLNFESCVRVTANGICSLIQSAFTLENIELGLSRCSQINDQDLKDIIDSVGKTLIKQLALDLRGCFNVSDQGMDFLGQELVNINRIARGQLVRNDGWIKSLALDFSRCEKISEEGVSSLIENIAKIHKLQNLSLSFNGCGRVSNKPIQVLATQLPTQFKELTSLSLEFFSCWRISDSGVIDLAQQIKYLKFLEDLKLDFIRCLGISKEAKEKVRKSVEFIPKRKILF